MSCSKNYNYICYSSLAINEGDLRTPLTSETALDEDIGVPVTANLEFHNPNKKKRERKLSEQMTTNGNDDPVAIRAVTMFPVELFCIYIYVCSLIVMSCYFLESLLTDRIRDGKKKSSKKKISPSLLQDEETTKKHRVAKIKCHSDLLQFIRTERQLCKLKGSQEKTNFENTSIKFYTKNLIKSQRKMFSEEMRNYLRELKEVEGDEETVAVLLKKIRKRIKQWVKY